MKKAAILLCVFSFVCSASYAFDISVPPSPESSVSFAAEELSSYVSQITGVRPLVFHSIGGADRLSFRAIPSRNACAHSLMLVEFRRNRWNLLEKL